VGDLHNPQRFDQLAFSELLAGAGAMLESSSSLSLQLDRAFGHVRRHSGPFVFNLPSNVQNADVQEAWDYRRAYGGYQPILPADEKLDDATRILADARRPAILVGLGAVRGRAAEVISELASYLQAPIATTLQAKGLCSNHPLWVGVSGGLGEGVALPALSACDVLLVVGASLNQWSTHNGDLVEGKTVLHVDPNSEVFGAFSRADVMLQGDARETVQALLERLPRHIPSRRGVDQVLQEQIEALWRVHRFPIAYETCEDGTIDPRQAVRELDRLLPKDRLVVAAGGHAGFSVNQLLEIRSPENWNYTIDFGAVGQGLATAIGAAFARPGKRVYHLTADGDFMMNLSDFDTAVRYKLPMTVIILNDQGFGQERHDLEHKSLPVEHAMQSSPDFVKLAEGFGARGSRFYTPDSLVGLEGALQSAEAFAGPSVFDIRINGAFELPVSQEIAMALA